MSVILLEDHLKIIKGFKRRALLPLVIAALALVLTFPFSSNESISTIDPRFQIIQILRNEPISVGVAVDITEVLIDECERSGVPVNLALSVLSCESEFKPWASSRTGARGLAQISPIVWNLYIKDKNLKDPRWAYTPALGIRVMVWFLDDLYRQYGSWDKGLRHYFSGNPNPSKQSDRYVRAVLSRMDA